MISKKRPLALTFGLCTVLLSSVPLCAQETRTAADQPAGDPVATATITPAPSVTARGPIPIRDSRPFNLIFLQFAPQDTTVLPRGQKALGLQFDIINNLLAPAPGGNGATVVEDNEVQRLQLSWRKGIARKTEAQIVLPILARNGGILDGPISAYHRLLSLGGNGVDNPAGRDSLPRGRSILFYQNAAGQTVSAGNAFGPGDISFFLKRELASGSRTALSVRAGIKAPTGSRGKYLGSGGFDAGVMLDSRVKLANRLYLYGSAGAVAMGSADRLPGAKSSMLQGSLALEWTRGSSSLIAQLDTNSRVVTTGNSFADGTQSTVTVGYKKQLRHNRTFYASFSENGDYHNYNGPSALGNVGPDFTLTLGMEWLR